MAADDTLVKERLDDLVSQYGPRTTDPAVFWAAQFDHGLAWVDFPEGLGGLGVRPSLQAVVNERLESAGFADNAARNPIGVGVAAAALAIFGRPEQQVRHLRPLFTCEEIWCQLFSEPDAGSDLAAVATTATKVGEAWVVSGTKLWVTLAHAAKWGLLLARTGSPGDRHEGLTTFAIDMDSAGVSVSPVRQMTGHAELNQVVLREVAVPDSQRLGEVGGGWTVAMTILARERVWLGRGAAQRGGGPIADALKIWNERTDKDPSRRDELMKLWVDAEVARLLTRRVANQVPGVGEAPQRMAGPAGAAARLATAQVNQRIYDFCLSLLGPAGLLYPSYEMDQPDEVGLGRKGVHHAYLRSQGTSLEGGSAEILRSILAERVLGLPRS